MLKLGLKMFVNQKQIKNGKQIHKLYQNEKIKK